MDADSFAVLVADWCLEIQPDQQILIETTTLAQEAAAAVYRATLERGAWPLLRLAPPSIDADLYRHARGRQLDHLAPITLAEAAAADASLRIEAPADTEALARVDPLLVARHERARQAQRHARAGHRWAVSIWPTQALADQAGMQMAEYARFVERAMFLDHSDPLGAWRELSARQAHLVSRLASARQVMIQAPRTDLTLDVADRTWVNSDGRRNMPSGEVYTGPHERSANGTIRFDLPSLARGSEVAGVELRFVDGEVVGARADVGDEHLQAALGVDAGARFLGELGIGTNRGIDRASGSTLLDEKIAGTIHLALGRSYPETGGVNDSALHWDLVCDLRSDATLTVDGEVVIRDGELVQ